MGRFRNANTLSIDGRQCVPFMWSRFSHYMTKREGGHKLFRDLILNNVVSCSVSAPSTHTDEVMAIANSSKTKIPVKQLHKCLDSYVASRGSVFFGFPGDCLDRIVRNYKDLWWW